MNIILVWFVISNWHVTSFSPSVIALRSSSIYVEVEGNLRLVCLIHLPNSVNKCTTLGHKKHKKMYSVNTWRLSILLSMAVFKMFMVVSCREVISFILFISAIVFSITNSCELLSTNRSLIISYEKCLSI